MYRVTGWTLCTLAAAAGVFGVIDGWVFTLPAVFLLGIFGAVILTDRRPRRQPPSYAIGYYGGFGVIDGRPAGERGAEIELDH